MNLKKLKHYKVTNILFVTIILINMQESVESRTVNSTNNITNWNANFISTFQVNKSPVKDDNYYNSEGNKLNNNVENGVINGHGPIDIDNLLSPFGNNDLLSNSLNEESSSEKIVLQKQNYNSFTKKTNGSTECKTVLCKYEASRMLYYIDHSADYKNFYEYACGGMRNDPAHSDTDPKEAVNKIIKDELNKIDQSRSITDKNLKAFYESCLNFTDLSYNERVQRGKEILYSLGVSFVNEGELFNFTQMIITLIQLDSFPVFDVNFEIDHTQINQLALKVSSEGKNIFDIDNEKKMKCRNAIHNLDSTEEVDVEAVYTYSYLKCMRNYTEYKKDIEEALSVFQVFKDKQTSSNQIKQIITTIETHLEPFYNIGLKSHKYHSFSDYSIKELNEKFTTVDWMYLFGTLLNKTINDEDRVYFLSKLEKVFNYIGDKKALWKLNNALLAHFTWIIYKYFVKPESSCFKREKFCLAITSELAPDVVSNLLMNKIDIKTLDEQKNEVQRIIESTRNTFLEEVNESSQGWLDDESVSAIKKKILSFKAFLPTHLEFGSKSNFEKVKMGKNYLFNALYLIKRKQRLIYSLHDKDTNSSEVIWMIYSRTYSKDSVYVYGINALAIPEVILLKHNKELPDAVTMARLGHVIANGFTRAFDETGIEIDHENKRKRLLSKSSFGTFEMTIYNVKNAFVNIGLNEGEKYFYVQIGKLNYETALTNQRFSDVSATKLAFETLKRRGRKDPEILSWGGFTKEQLYFLTLAQRFCTKDPVVEFLSIFENEVPPFVRAENIFSNSAGFIATFQLLHSDETSVIKEFPYLTRFGEGKLEA